MPYKQSHLAVANRTDLQQGQLVKKQRTGSRIHTILNLYYNKSDSR